MTLRMMVGDLDASKTVTRPPESQMIFKQLFGTDPPKPEKTIAIEGLGEFQLIGGYWEATVAAGAFPRLSVQIDTDGADLDESTLSLLRQVLQDIDRLNQVGLDYYTSLPDDDTKSACGCVKLDEVMVTPNDSDEDFNLSFNCSQWEDGFIMLIFKDFKLVSHLFAD